MAVNVQSVVGQASPVLTRKVVLKHSKAARVTPQRRSLAVRAAATGPGSPKRPELLHNVLQGADQFLTRYDVLSCGMGAMACTSFFVFQGQDPATALQITFAATVAGLVVNELFFDEF